jgi:hypothetical protein
LNDDSVEKPHLRRFFNFPLTATYDKYVSFLKNFVPCISGFLNGIMFQTFYSVINEEIGNLAFMLLSRLSRISTFQFQVSSHKGLPLMLALMAFLAMSLTCGACYTLEAVSEEVLHQPRRVRCGNTRNYLYAGSSY